MSSNSNLESITNDMEKENPLTAEAMGSTLLNKENLELKTEIPFNDEVWNTALMKSIGDMIELDFLELENVIEIVPINDKDPKTGLATTEIANYDNFKIFVKVEVENKDGTKTEVRMPLARYLGELWKRQIVYSEEYAVSHHRKGRTEVADMVGRKIEQQRREQPRGDLVSNLGGR